MSKPNAYGCVYEDDILTGTANNKLYTYTATTAYNYYGSLTLSSGTDEFVVYSSPYSGAFSLLNSMYIPRPCAYVSVNMTQLDYFYGQWEKMYDMKLSSGADQYVVHMGSNYRIMF